MVRIIDSTISVLFFSFRKGYGNIQAAYFEKNMATIEKIGRVLLGFIEICVPIIGHVLAATIDRFPLRERKIVNLTETGTAVLRQQKSETQQRKAQLVPDTTSAKPQVEIKPQSPKNIFTFRNAITVCCVALFAVPVILKFIQQGVAAERLGSNPVVPQLNGNLTLSTCFAQMSALPNPTDYEDDQKHHDHGAALDSEDRRRNPAAFCDSSRVWMRRRRHYLTFAAAIDFATAFRCHPPT